ncbi:VQ motif-containing protein 11-like [Magnolia sinica]|uniref:VQ motif-containing protein 11-like n=1 Tax=Magnolia sinica TaxID=86752 RepID=UPI00265AC5BE|nr:VQ motif-containing protein 11-like [Magnolia sinica]
MANKPSPSDQGSTLTTFVQADPSTFRALVQKLTGADGSSPHPKLPITVTARHSPKPVLADMGPRRHAFKLQERRQNMRKLEINPGPTPRHARSLKGDMMLVSPVSTLDRLFSCSPRTPTSPSLSLSSPSPSSSSPCWEEERAIAGKGFYLHPTAVNAPRSSEPELLPLFPLHSPKQPPPPPTS